MTALWWLARSPADASDEDIWLDAVEDGCLGAAIVLALTGFALLGVVAAVL